MQLTTHSKYWRGHLTPGLDAQGWEYLVVIAKAAWTIPMPGQRPRPLLPPEIEMSDRWDEAPAKALRVANDLARFKPRCDILFDGMAHSPSGRPERSWVCRFQVGELRKSARLHGPRNWQRLLGVVSLGDAEPTLTVPLHYGAALGGTRSQVRRGLGGERQIIEAHADNPDGRGWFGPQTLSLCDGEPAPQIEAEKPRIKAPDSKAAPHALGALPPYAGSRRRHAGTYDEAWQKEVFPFLPQDFDEQYNQAAAPDQQLAQLRGGEPVVLEGLVAGQAKLSFQLPRLDRLWAHVHRRDGTLQPLALVPDTLLFDLDAQRFSIVWRAALKLRRHPSEVSFVGIGPADAQWDSDSSRCTSCAGQGSFRTRPDDNAAHDMQPEGASQEAVA
ncbi:DUF2169 family type VI secretion system accessory protein [Pelomonas sp. BJYL3]|uniref:DUF2169 family type VI secretion system accessory protein n=1 Tax=Pelomonas sp. BJYL3 TaxID=2976697 RepID=UPI0022B43C56|nr:DUF2169 domain-containing protein [Pelomonas sp. BJYL3]